MSLTRIVDAIERTGLAARGALALADEERSNALARARTLVLVGAVGRRGWDAFAAAPESLDGAPDPLDRWSRRLIDGLARDLAATALYPFGGPPYWPFQRWALRAEPLHVSPIGMLIHPRYGLWLSYRGALAFSAPLELQPVARGESPCASCEAKPCLAACPVGAFSGSGYDVGACADHLRGPAGAPCMACGCLARRACPIGAEYAHCADQAAFHMRAFLRARPT